MSSIRTSFLLRVIVVDPEPFRDLLQRWFQPTMGWELRCISALDHTDEAELLTGPSIV
jgi:hypothetical protein